MFRRTGIFSTFLVMLAVSAVALAQDDCPALVQQALEAADRLCSATERNQACYGSIQIDATPQENVTDFAFSSPGDIEGVTRIQSLNLAAMAVPDAWGVMLMQVQANLPDTLPGQNATMLLFGEVILEDRREAALPTIQMDIRKNARVRSGPGTGYTQISSVRNGDTLTADGRNEAATWVRVRLEDGKTGWVLADTTSAQGPMAALAVLDNALDAGSLPYNPMQAFYFTTGIGNPQCAEAPRDGILIQTPEGEQSVSLVMNEVFIEVGSTILLRGQKSGDMTITVIEGEVRAAVNGRSVTAPAGTQVRVPLDANGIAAGEPELEVYAEEDVTGLPVSLLPRDISIAAPLTPAELDEVLTRNRTPVSGDWRLLSASCGERLGEIVPITFELAGTELSMFWFGSEMVFSQVEGGTYSDGERALYVLSPDIIESQNTLNGCSISLQRAG